MTQSKPLSDDLKNLSITSPAKIAESMAAQKQRGWPPKVLLSARDFIQLLDATLGLEVTTRTLQTYASPKLNLAPSPVKMDSHEVCYVYPDHFEWVAAVLTLRRVYHMPLTTIQALLAGFPHDQFHLIIERKLSVEDLLDLAKMMPRGFAVKDVLMAKASATMLQDLLPSSQALLLATEPGQALFDHEEQLLLARLDEMKSWVSGGRRRQFVQRESAEDFKNLAENRLIGKKISRKILARRSRARKEK